MSQNNKYNCLVNWGNGLSLFFAAIGSISVIVIVFLLLKKPVESSKNENVFKIEYSIQIDTLQLEKLNNKETIEYLKFIEQNNLKIAEDFSQQINDQYERMQKLAELREEQNLYNTYGAGIIAIILAIGSFFGFKSINQMHKDTVDTAESEAKVVADRIAKNVANEVAKNEIKIQIENIKGEVENTLKDLLLAEINKEVENKVNENSNELVSLRERANELIGRVEQILEEVNNNNTNSETGDSDSSSNENDMDTEGENDELEFQ